MRRPKQVKSSQVKSSLFMTVMNTCCSRPSRGGVGLVARRAHSGVARILVALSPQRS